MMTVKGSLDDQKQADVHAHLQHSKLAAQVIDTKGYCTSPSNVFCSADHHCCEGKQTGKDANTFCKLRPVAKSAQTPLSLQAISAMTCTVAQLANSMQFVQQAVKCPFGTKQ